MAVQDELKHGGNPQLPISISCIGDRYLVFDIQILSYLRREHRVCGMMVGTLPQAPSQNVFLGLPVQIMPEEAQLLVEKGVAVILDDAVAHDQVLKPGSGARRADYLLNIQKQTRKVEQLRAKEKEVAKKQILTKRKTKPAITPDGVGESVRNDLSDTEDAEMLEDDAAQKGVSSSATVSTTETGASYHVTLATSNLLLSDTESRSNIPIANLPASYPLYKHLNSKGYFTTPGLRFGCQYTVYPGDPLRYHSHFLAVGTQWNEEIDLMDIVGGGRLGTGVKKGYLIGGEDPGGRVRTFSIEWAAM